MKIILLFMYIFSFALIKSFPILSSSIVTGIILTGYCFVNSIYRNTVFSITSNRKVFLIFVYLIGIIIYCVFNATIQLTYEFSIVKTFVNQFIHLYIGILIFSLYKMKNQENKIIINIIYVFIIQSCIQFVSFISPSINEILNIFRSDDVIKIGQENYGYIRGLSISGSAFFGLGVGYGLVFILYFVKWNSLFPEKKFLRYLFLMLLIFGGASAARSSLVGLPIGILYFIINYIINFKGHWNFKLFIRPKSAVITTFGILLIIFTINLFTQNPNLAKQFERLNNFVFQIVYNGMETGNFTTPSTEKLFNEMYFMVPTKTFLIGDAMYTSKTGFYYMSTDAGYMRNILFFGVLGVLLLLFYQIKFFVWKVKENWLINFTILIYILILHIKGDILGFSIMLQSILFLVFLEKNFEITIRKITNYRDSLCE